jgi:predicted phosphoribosyltransferase
MAENVFFKDRADGGRALATALAAYRNSDCVVYGLPRGGAVTAREVSDDLSAPLDLLITRKLTHPYNPEYAIGAITDDGEVVLNEAVAGEFSKDYLEQEKARRLQEAKDRHAKYLGDRAPVPVEGKTAIVVDDGIATGYTMKAAILAVKKRKPAKIVVAAPVGPPGVAALFAGLADEVIVPSTPDDFFAIGYYYMDFAPVEDEQVVAAMKERVEA